MCLQIVARADELYLLNSYFKYMNLPFSPWACLMQDPQDVQKALVAINANQTCQKTQFKSKNPSINGSFDEPVRKGRKPEVSKHHPAVLKCRELFQAGVPLHRVSIEVGVDYAMLARWFDKGWMDIPRKRRTKTAVSA